MHAEHRPEDTEDEERPDPAADDVAADDSAQTDKDHGDSAPLPFAPHKDDHSAFGDTDQHSTA